MRVIKFCGELKCSYFYLVGIFGKIDLNQFWPLVNIKQGLQQGDMHV